MSTEIPYPMIRNEIRLSGRTIFLTRIRRRLLRDPALVFGWMIIVGVGLSALFPTLLSPYDPNAQDLASRLLPPGGVDAGGGRHWLGTDWVGRDLLSRIAHGSRVSMSVAAFAVVVRVVLGSAVGMTSGFYGGLADTVFMRLADIQLALPFLLLAVAVAAVFGPSLLNVILVLGVTGWMAYGRLVRAQVLSLREKEFVEAARALGVADWQIITRHILPNVLGSVIALAAVDVPALILAESSLSFLGVGVPMTTPSWGGMVALGRNHLTTAWWVPVLPGLAIAVVVLGISLVGDWLRDELDPTLR
ncbi:MAG TPA: ABC transporter permease [Anaerolineales bacterium]|nr:ABC transporter permease [Anaerolineales bacterium]